MDDKVLYFIDLGKNTKFIFEHREQIIKEKYAKVINNDCIQYMTTLEGRLAAMSTFWGSNYNVPIYINERICFLKIDKNLWINVFKVEKIVEKNVVFDCGKVVNYTLSERSLHKKITKINKIIKNVKK